MVVYLFPGADISLPAFFCFPFPGDLAKRIETEMGPTFRHRFTDRIEKHIRADRFSRTTFL